MSKNIFIEYANHSFKDNSDNLNIVFNQQSFEKIISKPYLDYYICATELIGVLATINDPKAVMLYGDKAEHFLQDNSKGYWQDKDGKIYLRGKADTAYLQKFYKEAARAVYGFEGGYCEKQCRWKTIRDKFFEPRLLQGPGRLKCHECDQLYFIKVLSEIIKGTEYNEIDGFKFLLFLLADCAKLSLEFMEDREKSPFQITIGKKMSFSLPTHVFSSPDPIFGISLRERIFGIAIYSLIKFLIENDRRKLKQCPVCDRFFEGRLNKRYCSKNCNNRANKLSKEEMRIYQKEYRKRRKKIAKKKSEFDEKEIERIMRAVGWPRRDVIEMFKEDREM